jgi:hypothetical protein
VMTSILKPNDDFKIFCDGERIIIVWQDSMWIFDDAILTNIDFTVRREPIEISTFGSDYKAFLTGRSSMEINFSLIGTTVLRQDKSNILLGQDLFKSISVLDLIKAINSKIKNRK